MSIYVEVPAPDFNLDLTVQSGQLFRWTQVEGQWSGCIGSDNVTISQHDAVLRVTAADPGTSPADLASAVAELFRLEAPLAKIRTDLLERDTGLEGVLDRFAGLRVTAQPPVECLLTFVCAVATNINRIRWSIDELSRRFGCRNGVSFCFPELEALAAADPSELRVGAMEFRCRSLSRASRALYERGGERWLASLGGLTYEQAAAELVQIPSVGPKVADCALLFSLGFDEAFPLDTHTRRIARLRYGIEAAATPRGYAEVSRRLRELLGPYAGWAQQYLYVESLAAPRTRSAPKSAASAVAHP